jgi:undecaprenyl-diphosphatase
LIGVGNKTPGNLIIGTRGVHGWLRQNIDLLMLVVLAAMVISILLVAALADEVSEGSTQRYDEWVLRQLRVPGDATDPIGPKWFEDMWRDVTALGSVTVLGLVTMSCAG